VVLDSGDGARRSEAVRGGDWGSGPGMQGPSPPVPDSATYRPPLDHWRCRGLFRPVATTRGDCCLSRSEWAVAGAAGTAIRPARTAAAIAATRNRGPDRTGPLDHECSFANRSTPRHSSPRSLSSWGTCTTSASNDADSGPPGSGRHGLAAARLATDPVDGSAHQLGGLGCVGGKSTSSR
jgi:hypothetical protein